MTMQSRRRPARPLLAATLALAALGSPAALAQSGGEAGAPAPEAASDAPLIEDRGERLSRFISKLADVDEGAYDRWENEIRWIWSRSGSDSVEVLLRGVSDAL
jgi:hypothetical protein